MRATASEKLETIRLVEGSELGVKRTLSKLGVARSTFYRWYDLYERFGFDGLKCKQGCERNYWNRIPEDERKRIVEIALQEPEMSPRQLAWHITDTQGCFVSESSVYRILKAQDLITSPNFVVIKARDKFKNPTRRVHEMWQTDFTYFKITGWGWYYMLSILDDYSRYIIAWKLYTTMETKDVKDLLEIAIKKTGTANVHVHHRPRLLSDNGPCFVSSSLKDYLGEKGMAQTHGRPYHPQTQGKIERFHGSMKNIIKLRNYYVPDELQENLEAFIQYYNHERVHESLDNLTPADVYEGRSRDILSARQVVKEQTLKRRRRINRGLSPGKEILVRPAIFREVSIRN